MKWSRGVIFTAIGILTIITTFSLLTDASIEVIVGNLLAGSFLIAFAAACQTQQPPINHLLQQDWQHWRLTG